MEAAAGTGCCFCCIRSLIEFAATGERTDISCKYCSGVISSDAQRTGPQKIMAKMRNNALVRFTKIPLVINNKNEPAYPCKNFAYSNALIGSSRPN